MMLRIHSRQEGSVGAGTVAVKFDRGAGCEDQLGDGPEFCHGFAVLAHEPCLRGTAALKPDGDGLSPDLPRCQFHPCTELIFGVDEEYFDRFLRVAAWQLKFAVV